MRNDMKRRARGKRSAPARNASLRRDAASLYRSMTTLLRVYQFRDRDHVGYRGLTITQCYVIDLLIGRPDLTLNELSAEIGLDKSTLSRVVETLARRRLIVKRRHPVDGRSTLLAASAAGAARYRLIQDDIIAENCQVLAKFPAGIRGQIAPVLDALTGAAIMRRSEAVDD